MDKVAEMSKEMQELESNCAELLGGSIGIINNLLAPLTGSIRRKKVIINQLNESDEVKERKIMVMTLQSLKEYAEELIPLLEQIKGESRETVRKGDQIKTCMDCGIIKPEKYLMPWAMRDIHGVETKGEICMDCYVVAAHT